MHLVIEPLSEADRLEQMHQCLQTYLAHELPNKLVAIQGFAQLLAEDGLTNEEGQDTARSLAALARRVDERARRLADIGRLLREPAAGPPLRLNSAAREVAEGIVSRSPSSFTCDVIGQDVEVGVSARLLHAVLRELLLNALPSGHALIETREAFLAVSDKGKGVGAPLLLLEPFRAGLGFFLVRQAASRWSAPVVVASSPGTGTRVEIRFPLAPKEAG